MNKLIEEDGFYQRKWYEYNFDKGLNYISMYRVIYVSSIYVLIYKEYKSFGCLKI